MIPRSATLLPQSLRHENDRVRQQGSLLWVGLKEELVVDRHHYFVTVRQFSQPLIEVADAFMLRENIVKFPQ